MPAQSATTSSGSPVRWRYHRCWITSLTTACAAKTPTTSALIRGLGHCQPSGTVQRHGKQDQYHRKSESYGMLEFVGERKPRRLWWAADTVEPPQLQHHRDERPRCGQVPATQRESLRVVRQGWVRHVLKRQLRCRSVIRLGPRLLGVLRPPRCGAHRRGRHSARCRRR